jgi:hypothetical protein
MQYIHHTTSGIRSSALATYLVLETKSFSNYCILNIHNGCETRSLILREEHGLTVFENRVLRSIFEPKRDEVTGGWRNLHNEELNKLYSSPSIIRIIKSWG